jgi:hypothetical protein
MQIGNQIGLTKRIDPKERLFKIDSFEGFIQCVSTLAHVCRNMKCVHVQFLSADKFKLAVTRAAYFCFLKEELHRSNSDGSDIGKLHSEYKSSYLIPILCRENEEFAELVYRETVDGITSEALMKLVSISDGSGITTKIMQEYFNACKNHKQEYESVLCRQDKENAKPR